MPPRSRLGLLLGALLVSTASTLNVDLWGVNYDLRSGPDWAPDANRCKPAVQVQRELRVLAGVTSRVRTYSLADCPVGPVLEAARTLGLSVWLGIWTASDPAVFERELSALQTLVAPSSPDRGYFFPAPTGNEDVGDNAVAVVDGMNVGSEAVYRGDVTASAAVECLSRVRQVLREASTGNATAVGSKLPPLAITDIVDVLLQYPELVAAGDVVTVNVFPFWERVGAGKAAARIEQRLRPLRTLATALGKDQVIITETGWASAGSDARASPASPANMAKFVGKFAALASHRKWPYYYFAGFDTPYKAEQLQDPSSVEASFGLFNVNGTMKPAIAALVVDLVAEDDKEEKEEGGSGSTGSSESVDASEGSDEEDSEQSASVASSRGGGEDSQAEAELPAAASDSAGVSSRVLSALSMAVTAAATLAQW